MSSKKFIYGLLVSIVTILITLLIYRDTLGRSDIATIVYAHYKNDTLKLKAAQFLIDNMKWHTLDSTLISCPEHIQQLIEEADSVYKFITQGVNNEILMSGAMGSWLRHRGKQYSAWRDTTFIFPKTYKQNQFKCIDAEFIIKHIDNAFERWKTSPYAKKLSFESFCEYILPFVALNEEAYVMNGSELYKQFSPHLDKTAPQTLPNIIARYSNYINSIRTFTSTKQEVTSYGWKDVFLKKDPDCIPLCDVECNVLRAMGVPTAIDMNIGNREFIGQHHHCVVFNEKGKEIPFHGEGVISKTEVFGYAVSYKLNIYRHLYGAQSDSPYMLRGENESLPDFFKTPALKDVTSYIKPVAQLTLSIPDTVENNLTWLYTYSRSDKQGIRAVTWGINDHTNHVSTFENVVKNMLYFPAYLDNDENVHFVGEPIVVMEGLNYQEVFSDRLTDYCVGNSDTIQDIVMTRKFPRKSGMIKEAQNMVGGIWYGAQHRDGRDKVKLAEIDFLPEAYLQEIKIKKPQAYKYYIYESAEGKNSRFGEIEFLTKPTYNYENTKPPTPLPVLAPEKIERDLNERIKLLPLNTKGKEFDGDQQTANSGSLFRYEFPEPQIVTSIVFAPINADNGIKPNESYQLFQWKNGWQEIDSLKSEFDFLEFKQLDTRKLYWLKNNSRGKEEVPFIIVNNHPAFIYYDCMRPPVKQAYKILSTDNYKCIASSEEPVKGSDKSGYARFLVDADTTNSWHSRYTGTCPPYPHWLEIDTRKIQKVNGFVIKLRRNGNKPKFIKVLGSMDKNNWQEIGTFELRRIDKRQEIFFRKEVKLRYLKVELLNGQNNEPHSAIVYLKLLNYKK